MSFHARIEARALWRRRGLISVVALILMLGIGAVQIALIPVLNLTANPAGERGNLIFNVQLDNQAPNSPYARPGEPPVLVSYRDASSLLRIWGETLQVMMYPAFVVASRDGAAGWQFEARVTTGSFFELFGPKFRFGKPWDAGGDDQAVAVLSAGMNRRLFDGGNSVGQYISVDGARFEVVGVLEEWLPIPRYFDLRNGALAAPEDLYLPLHRGVEMGVQRAGSRDCWPPYQGSEAELLVSECIWLNFWVELTSTAQKERYEQMLVEYTRGQMELGRYPNGVNHRLRDVPTLLRLEGLITRELKIQLSLAVVFWIFCLLNALVLMLTYTTARGRDMFVHRVVGATRAGLLVRQLIIALAASVLLGSFALFIAAGALAFERSFVPEMQYVATLDFGAIPIVWGLSLLSAVCTMGLPGILWRPSRSVLQGRG